MKYMFKFPDIGEGLEEGKIIEWYVQKGQMVSSGDALVKMETDKVVTDIPSPKKGVISAMYGAVGETVHVGSVLVELDIEGISGEAAIETAKEEIKKASTEQVEEKGFGVVGTIEVAGDGAYLPASNEATPKSETILNPIVKKVLATPVARAMAKDRGIDINSIIGSGPAGRVSKKDIESYQSSHSYASASIQTMKSPSHEQAVEIVPLSQIRKTIAKNMIRSKQHAAHMSVMDEVVVDDLVSLRTKVKQDYDAKGISISYLPFIIKSIALALKSFPVLNAELDLEAGNIIYKKYINIGIAVDTADGLVVPVIRNADTKSIIELATELNLISQKARDRKLSLEDMKGGTFTVTSYGSVGGYFAVPVINYPQVAIFGIGKLSEKPIVKDSQIVVGKVLPISMSVDHRIVDGGDVARFLNMVLDFLKNPHKMLVL